MSGGCRRVIASLVLATSCLAYGQVSWAGGEETLVKCAIGFKQLLNRFHDPWSRAAAQTDVSSYRQPVLNHENVVVAPLWKVRGMDNPVGELRKSLPELKAAGVTTIYMPPMYEQMLYDFFGTLNIHGYWPKNFDLTRIDPKLGSNADYLKFLSEARAAGFKLALDIDPRHLGYAPENGQVTLWGKEISVHDPEFFVQAREPSAKDFAAAELAGPSKAGLYTDLKMWGLPFLNHSNPWVRKNVIEDHARAIDLGYSTFRIDSAKHMRSDFLRDLMTEMVKRGESAGIRPKFILEYFSGNYGELAYKLHEIGAIPGLQFIDFRMAGAVREAVDGKSFASIRAAAVESEKLGLDRGYLIQAITDQDAFYPPIYAGTLESEGKTYAALMLSNMTSTNRPYYVAGIEQAEAPGTLRNAPRRFFDSGSPPAAGVARINEFMNQNFDKLMPFSSSDILEESGDQLVIKRRFKDGKKALLLVVDRSRSSKNVAKAIARYKPSSEVFRWGEFGREVETYLAVTSP